LRSVPLPFLSKITLLWTRAREPGPVSPVKVDSPLPFPWTQRGEIYTTARVERSGDLLRIYSADLKVLLATHTVTWSRTDSFCEGQYESLAQPEEFPTAPVQTQIFQLPKPSQDLSFAKFDFDKEDQV
jgi:hypothetical protein